MLIDEWPLSKLEKFSHWFQRLTGKDCFWLAKSLLMLSALAAITEDFLMFLIERKAMVYAISMLTDVVFVLIYAFLLMIIHAVYLRLSRKNIGVMNPARLDLLFARLFVVILIVVVGAVTYYEKLMLIMVISILQDITFILMLYFVSCTPLPPCQSKIKQWIDQAIGVLQETLSPPLPEPQRVIVQNKRR